MPVAFQPSRAVCGAHSEVGWRLGVEHRVEAVDEVRDLERHAPLGSSQRASGFIDGFQKRGEVCRVHVVIIATSPPRWAGEGLAA
jgi:hypothetical protein